MITYRTLVTDQAKLDLYNIDEYISVELLAPNSAQKILNSIERKINSLKIFPERGALYDKEPWRSKEVRIVQIKHYKIVFKIDKKAHTVTILHIIYAKRDIDALMK